MARVTFREIPDHEPTAFDGVTICGYTSTKPAELAGRDLPEEAAAGDGRPAAGGSPDAVPDPDST
jgi:hypothetical protein